MSGKRNSAYYLDRLEREHPTVFADWKAGKYRSALQAFYAAGLKTPRSPSTVMKNEWTKASPAERKQFLEWLTSEAPGFDGTRRSPPSTAASSTGPLDSDKRLTPDAKKTIEDILRRRSISPCVAMYEMGYSKYDASLGRALADNTRLLGIDPDLLAKWIAENVAAGPKR